MDFFSIIFVAFGLAMDAFAVSVSKGISLRKINIKIPLIYGFSFGIFQFVMFFAGSTGGKKLPEVMMKADRFISFFLLAAIGINMIVESLKKDEEKNFQKVNLKNMVLLSIATSIDALAAGVSFCFYPIPIFFNSLCVGIFAFSLSFLGVYFGKFIGKWMKNAEAVGGVILLVIACKIIFTVK